jgi:endonuclease/exonuclease/phosphatase family metal-dependent hydrolase
MIDRLEILAARTRRLISRTRWAGRLLGYPPPPEGEHAEAGLILIQIDGLGMDVFLRALDEGRIPFLAQLLENEGYTLRPLYTGIPSSTPAVQAELLYGQKTAVPAFGYRDSELDRIVSSNDPSVAAALEARLKSESPGLIQGGSSWGNLFCGGAGEPHLCASTAGFDLLWKSLNVFRILGILFWYSWSLLRVFGNAVIETGAAILDFAKQRSTGRELWAELRFIPMRVLITAVMREIVTAGASIDAERGLPIIHVNYLGYDEHAHRRGPHSRLARWALRGINMSIQRVWLAAHRSTARDYQIWIYSDHGQETVVPYPLEYGCTVSRAVEDVVEKEAMRIARRAERRRAAGAERAHWLTRDLPGWAQRGVHPQAFAHGGIFLADAATVIDDGLAEDQKPRVEVVHQGPVGMVYLRDPLDDAGALDLARRLAGEGRIPLVLRRAEDGTAHAFTHRGEHYRLPAQGGELFGEDHPFLRDVVADTLRVVHHDEAGDFVLMGFDRERPFSLQLEHGSHGGPGAHETRAIALLPPEATAGHRIHGTLRPEILGRRARHVLGGVMSRSETAMKIPVVRGPNGANGRRLRILSYNVHGCRGMDGKYSPQRIARVISREQPDIVCLQELDQGRTRSGGVEQITEIARSLETDYSFHSVFEVDDGMFGNAVLSHHRLIQLGHAPLPALGSSVPSLEPRGVLRVQVCLGDGCIEVVNTHLSILERERRLQVAELIAGRWLQPDGGGNGDGNPAGGNPNPAVRPLVLCGDFNASPRSFTCRRLDEYLDSIDHRYPAARRLKTWSSRIALRRIDQVFVNESVTVVAARVPRNRLTRVASDHLPLVVDLEVGI